MKVAVAGMWHLGTVTAACLAAAGHDVTGIDDDQEVIANLNISLPPVAEPGLAELTRQQLEADRLRFSTRFADAAGNEVVWLAYDTPVDEDDGANIEYVVEKAMALLPHMSDASTMLISSQLPVGSTSRMEQRFAALQLPRKIHFAYSPENLRLGKAIEVFSRPDRIVVGVANQEDRERLAPLFAPITDRIEWMPVKSAEMTKHAINAWLACSVSFANEIATLCESLGADAQDVERGLKSDVRIGPRAYLRAGGPFAGGTLARDVAFLEQLGEQSQAPLYLLGAVRKSNEHHKGWIRRQLKKRLIPLSGKVVCVLGLTYKPGTDTLRRSPAVETCRWLAAEGANVQAFDPAINRVPTELGNVIGLMDSPEASLTGADALWVATEWPQFRSLDAETVAGKMRSPLVLDPNRHLEKALGNDRRIGYVSVGRSDEAQG